jgi:hypothetical protein
VLVFLVTSFILVFPPISYMHSSSPTFVLHALPMSSSLTWSFQLYLAKSKGLKYIDKYMPEHSVTSQFAHTALSCVTGIIPLNIKWLIFKRSPAKRLRSFTISSLHLDELLAPCKQFAICHWPSRHFQTASTNMSRCDTWKHCRYTILASLA